MPLNKTLIAKPVLEELVHSIYVLGVSKSLSIRKILGEGKLCSSRPSILRLVKTYNELDLDAPASTLKVPKGFNVPKVAEALAKLRAKEGCNEQNIINSLYSKEVHALYCYMTKKQVYDAVIACNVIYNAETVADAVWHTLFSAIPANERIIKTDRKYVGIYPLGYWK